jgi:hypothetical protein
MRCEILSMTTRMNRKRNKRTVYRVRGWGLVGFLLSLLSKDMLASEHYGQVPLRGVVRASTSIRVNPTPLASNLDIDGDASNGPIANITVFSNTQYRIRLFSDNWVAEDGVGETSYFLRQAGTSLSDPNSLGERIRYVLTFDGLPITPDSEGSYLVINGAATGNVGRISSLNIVIQGNDSYSAGVYSDWLTIVVSPDTSFPIN